MSKKTQEMYEKIHNLIGRLAGATGARRKMQDQNRNGSNGGGSRHAETRFAQISLERWIFEDSEHEVGVTASYDGAILLGNYRGDSWASWRRDCRRKTTS